MKKEWISILLFLTIQVLSLSSYAQYDESEEIDTQVDNLLYSEDSQPEEKDGARIEERSLKLKDLSELRFLAPFEDIAVIQKKYLAKTERFELFPNIGVILNDAFFVNQILSIKAAYHFTEKWAFELNTITLSQNDKSITEDLAEKSITTESIVVPKSYFGGDIKWTPYYGKMSFVDSSIVPFDTYFTAGLGSMKTNQATKPTALHIGLGQNFALSKSLALRWDTSFFWYNAKKTETGTSSLYTNIHFTIGASFFFPEASYR